MYQWNDGLIPGCKAPAAAAIEHVDPVRAWRRGAALYACIGYGGPADFPFAAGRGEPTG